jgi:hypothetical protein
MDVDLEETPEETPIDPARTAVLAVSTTLLAIAFLLLLIGDQVTAAGF